MSRHRITVDKTHRLYIRVFKDYGTGMDVRISTSLLNIAYLEFLSEDNIIQDKLTDIFHLCIYNIVREIYRCRYLKITIEVDVSII